MSSIADRLDPVVVGSFTGGCAALAAGGLLYAAKVVSHPLQGGLYGAVFAGAFYALGRFYEQKENDQKILGFGFTVCLLIPFSKEIVSAMGFPLSYQMTLCFTVVWTVGTVFAQYLMKKIES